MITKQPWSWDSKAKQHIARKNWNAVPQHTHNLVLFILTLIFDKLNHIINPKNCYGCFSCKLGCIKLRICKPRPTRFSFHMTINPLFFKYTWFWLTCIIFTLLIAGSITPASRLFLTVPLERSSPMLQDGKEVTRQIQNHTGKFRRQGKSAKLKWGHNVVWYLERCCLSALVCAVWWYARSFATNSVASLAAFKERTCTRQSPLYNFSNNHKRDH